MEPRIQVSRPPDANSRRSVRLAGGVIAAAALAAYANSFHGPLVFDDVGTIAENQTIRHLWPIWSALQPPAEGMPVTGRPIANLSLALNYAWGGTNVWGYHAVNLLIHILCGLTLFGIVRRTLKTHATLIAFAVALIWTLHPLQTESVTYISQRAESLMGLFYLLTLYGFIRYADESDGERRKAVGGNAKVAGGSKFSLSAFRFLLLSLTACLLGMATKEVMATAPVMVLLYDRTFVSGSFREAWRVRRKYYLALGGTWLLLAALLAGSGSRGGTAGFAAEIPWPTYAVTQFRAVAHYLRLAVWPDPLVFFYGSTIGAPAGALAVDVTVVVGLLAATIWLLFRPATRKEVGVGGGEAPLRPADGDFGGQALGFAGAWFFLILAPSSSVVPVATETIAEHRMYLSLAAVVAVGVGAIFSLAAAVARSRSARPERLAVLLCLIVAAGCGAATARRNEDYRSERALWQKTADAFPGNAVAQYNLAIMLARAGRPDEAIARYREALRLKPDYFEARNNLGEALAGAGRWTEAIDQYREALRLDPGYAMIHVNLGDALLHLGRLDEAIASYEEGVRVEPDSPNAYFQLGAALVRAGRAPEAIAVFENLLQLSPDAPDARTELGYLLARSGRLPEAIAQFQEVARLRPDAVAAHDNLGSALAQVGRTEEAAGEFAAASRLQPDNPELHNDLGCALAQLGRTAEARSQFEAALRLAPNDAEARANLARLPRD